MKKFQNQKWRCKNLSLEKINLEDKNLKKSQEIEDLKKDLKKNRIDPGKIVLNIEMENIPENLDDLFTTISYALILVDEDTTDFKARNYSALLESIYKARVNLSQLK